MGVVTSGLEDALDGEEAGGWGHRGSHRAAQRAQVRDPGWLVLYIHLEAGWRPWCVVD